MRVGGGINLTANFENWSERKIGGDENSVEAFECQTCRGNGGGHHAMGAFSDGGKMICLVSIIICFHFSRHFDAAGQAAASLRLFTANLPRTKKKAPPCDSLRSVPAWGRAGPPDARSLPAKRLARPCPPPD